jgi:hypothetical protein
MLLQTKQNYFFKKKKKKKEGKINPRKLKLQIAPYE